MAAEFFVKVVVRLACFGSVWSGLTALKLKLMPPSLSPSSLVAPISWPSSPPCRRGNVHVCIPITISLYVRACGLCYAD